MKFLHTMIRVSDLEKSLHFFCEVLGMKQVSRYDVEAGRFTLVFLSADGDFEQASQSKSPTIELTYNWDPEQYAGGRNFGHLAFQVDNIYDTCDKIAKAGITINRPPRDGHMAFIRTPDNISIELLQKGDSLPPEEPWASASNIGEW